MKEISKSLLLAIDLDGTLCIGESWTSEECLKCIPIKKNIDFINSVYGKHHIIIYTARNEELRTETEFWLKKNKVKYHALRMDKLGCDFYFDDKSSRTLDDFKKLLNML